MARIDPKTKKYKPSWFERFMRWATNEENGILSDSPPIEQKNEAMQKENEEYYYKLKSKFDEYPEVERINNLYLFEMKDGKGNAVISRYPVYAVITYNIAYVVGFTGLNYYSYALRFDSYTSREIGDWIWRCLYGIYEFDTYSLKKYTGLSNWPVLRDMVEESIKKKFETFRLKFECDKYLAEYTSRLRHINRIIKHRWNKIDSGYILFLEREWKRTVNRIPKNYVRYILPKSLEFPSVPFETKEIKENRKKIIENQI